MQTAKWGASCWFALIMLAARLAVLTAQSSSTSSSPTSAATRSAWPEVDLNVLDDQGALQKVGKPEIHLFENGVERPIKILGSPDSPVSVALMIDGSGSVFQRKDAIVAAAKAIVKRLPEGSEVMAVLFSEKAFLDLPFTPVSKVDLSFVDQMQAGGRTALYDAIFATEDGLIAHARYARRALVILSDGEDNASHLSRGNAFWKMEQPGAAVVYPCVLSKANILQRDLMVGHINMRFLAKEGGGIGFSLDPDPESAASQIANAIRNQYALEFTAADPTRDGRKRKIAVQLGVKGAQIHATPAYFAPLK